MKFGESWVQVLLEVSAIVRPIAHFLDLDKSTVNQNEKQR